MNTVIWYDTVPSDRSPRNEWPAMEAGALTFPSNATMISVDLTLVAISIIATSFVLGQWARLRRMHATGSALLVLIGVWIQASIYIADLFSMTVLPFRLGEEAAHQFMISLHTYYGWYASLVAITFILLSLMLFTLSFVSHQSRIDRLTEDLSDRNEELKFTKQRLDVAISSAQIGSFDIDLLTGKSEVSSSWKSLMGFDPADEIDAQAEWRKRVHPDDLPVVESADAACISGRTARSESEYRAQIANGSWRWMKSVAAPYEPEGGGHVSRLVGVQFDITEAKEVEHTKQELISTVSHELRTPITSINGALRIITHRTNDLAEDTIKLLSVAQRNTDRLKTLVDDLLETEMLSSDESSKYKLVSTNIGELSELTAESIRPGADAANVRIDFENRSEKCTSTVDADRLEQVLTNLVSNAIKFSPEDGIVQIRVENDAGSVRVAVTDQGPGIQSEFSEKVFNRFAKAEGSDKNNPNGAGLGLYISKRLVEDMGGQIGFQSEPDVATTFWVSFPMDAKKPLARSGS